MLSSSKGFFPYSTTFLQELGAGEESPSSSEAEQPTASSAVAAGGNNALLNSKQANREKKKLKKQRARSLQAAKEEIMVEDSVDVNEKRFKVVPLEEGVSFLVACNDDTLLFLLGHCYITPLKGSVSIDGYEMEVGKQQLIHRSLWLPALRVQLSTAGNAKKKAIKISHLDKSALDTVNKIDLSHFKCCFVYQGIKESQQEWMVKIEDKSVLSLLASNFEMKLNSSDTWKVTSFAKTISSLLSISTILDTFSIECMQAHPSWVEGGDAIVKDWQQGAKEQITAAVCGAKGAGKSSFVRYLANRLLSYQSTEGVDLPVCIIDCDLGQPELTIPGMVSLTVLKSPLLSATHFNLQKPEISVLIGDITSRHEPEVFCESLKLVLKKYEEINEKYQKRAEKGSVPTPSTSTTTQNNRFSLLINNDKNITTTAKNDTLAASTSISRPNCIPLLINTDGNIRYMGSEILNAIAEIANPSHVFHLRSPEDHDLQVLESIRDRDAVCKLFMLERGGSGRSRTQAVDLRNIRYASWFLRSAAVTLPTHIKPKPMNSKANSQPVTSILMVNADENDDEMAQDSDNVATAENPFHRSMDSLYIKNATLVGSEDCGALGLALLNKPCIAVPFDKIIFNFVQLEVDPMMILASISGNLVGCSCAKASTAVMHTTTIMDTDDKLFDIKHFQQFQVLPNDELAIVRAVDVKNRLVLLIPSTLKEFDVKSVVLTLASNAFVPNYMLYGAGFPTYPYYASEFTGEGAIQSRVRPNLKRKAHDK